MPDDETGAPVLAEAAAAARPRESGPLSFFALTPLAPGASISAADVPSGLLFALVVAGPNGDSVASCWTDKDHYEAGIRVLVPGVPAPADPKAVVTNGVVGAVRVRRPGFWKRLGLGTKILYVAGILGALSGIRGYFGFLFEPPELAIFQTNTRPLDVLSGDPVEVPLRILGRTASTPVSLHAVTVVGLKSPVDHRPLDFDVNSVPPVGPGQSVDITLRGFAPAKKEASSGPDSYLLDFGLSGGAGRLWFDKTFFAPNREVRVWSALAIETPRLEERPSTQAIYRGSIFVGRAQTRGISGYAVTRDLRVEVLRFTIDDEDAAADAPITDGPVCKQEWAITAPALEPFKAHAYRLLVGVRAHGHPLSADVWQKISPEIVHY